MIGFVQVGNQAHADRYAYLALIGLELALAWSAAELVGSQASRIAAAVLGLGALALVSAYQLAFWRSSQTLFERALAVTDRNFVIENQLGLVLGERDLDGALRHFEAELNAGKARYRKGELSAARAAFERAVASKPTSGEAHLFLAIVLGREGDHERADAELARALEREPGLVDDARARKLGEALLERLGGD